MKLFAKFPAIALLFIATLAFAASCSKSASGPANEFVQITDKYTEKIAQCADIQEMQQINQESIDDLAKFANSDYVLTDADKSAIKNAMRGLLETGMEKVCELTGQQLPDGSVDMAATMIDGMIDNATTLGEIHALTNKR